MFYMYEHVYVHLCVCIHIHICDYIDIHISVYSVWSQKQGT